MKKTLLLSLLLIPCFANAEGFKFQGPFATDDVAILNQDTLQEGASFYVHHGSATTMESGAFIGDGSGITNISTAAIPNIWVKKAGDTMSGQLTLLGSTLTVGGSEFSVGGSTLIVDNGTVGIGIADTGIYKFRVEDGLSAFDGHMHIFGNNTDSKHLKFYTADGLGSGQWSSIQHKKASAGIAYLLFDSSYDKFVFDNSAGAKVGIGITTPTNPFQVGSSTFIVQANGNVGIGTTSPTEILFVVGNSSITGIVTASTFNAIGSAYQMNGITVIDSNKDISANDISVTGLVDGRDIAGDFTALSASTVANKTSINANASLLTTVAVDTTTIVSNQATVNANVAIDSTTIVSDQATVNTYIASDTTTIVSDQVVVNTNIATDTTTIVSNQATVNTNVASDTTTIAGNVSTNAADLDVIEANMIWTSSDVTWTGSHTWESSGTFANPITASRYDIAGSTVLTLSSNSSLHVGVGAGNVNTGDNNTFLGKNAGILNTTGAGNSFLGTAAGYSNSTGTDNTFVGFYAGVFNTTGKNNTFIGRGAGYTNSTGKENTFTGYGAGFYNTGSYNSFYGHKAGEANTTGANNIFVGNQTGYTNTSGSGNSFVGVNAGYTNNGSNNSFVGHIAGFSNTSGGNNSFFGYGAGWANTTGANNTFLGWSAGVLNSTGTNNTFVGYGAGYYNSGGERNSFLGYRAGDNVTTGSNNIIIGYNLNAPSVSTNSYLSIGDLIYGNMTSGKVGIGTTSPDANLHVSDSSGFAVIKSSGISGGCLMFRDTDNNGWTECKFLDGVMTCAIDADGICD